MILQRIKILLQFHLLPKFIQLRQECLLLRLLSVERLQFYNVLLDMVLTFAQKVYKFILLGDNRGSGWLLQARVVRDGAHQRVLPILLKVHPRLWTKIAVYDSKASQTLFAIIARLLMLVLHFTSIFYFLEFWKSSLFCDEVFNCFDGSSTVFIPLVDVWDEFLFIDFNWSCGVWVLLNCVHFLLFFLKLNLLHLLMSFL